MIAGESLADEEGLDCWCVCVLGSITDVIDELNVGSNKEGLVCGFDFIGWR